MACEPRATYVRLSFGTLRDYDAVFDPVRKRRQEYNGHQAGDPAKAAQALLRIIDARDPPTHLLLGYDAKQLVEERLTALGEEMRNWDSITRSTDFG